MNKKISIGVGVVLITIFAVSFMTNSVGNNIHKMDMDEKSEMFISLKNSIQDELRPQHKYRCCLEKACTSCVSLTPWHGEGASCDCLKDIIEGVHPCGECIGGILAGRGSPYLTEYFAKAIAEKTGHEDTLKQIIFEKYGTPIEDQT